MQVVFVVLLAIPLFGQYPSGFFLVGVATVCLSIQVLQPALKQAAATLVPSLVVPQAALRTGSCNTCAYSGGGAKSASTVL